MSTISAIIPGAGTGSRFGSTQNKIFAKIQEKPIFLHTLTAFANHPDVNQIIFVVSAADKPKFQSHFGDELDALGVTMVTGGATRTESVRNALAVVRADADLIAVHDAARPCIAKPWLDRVFKTAQREGAALLAWRIFGTVKLANGKLVRETLDREVFDQLYEGQTPQVFKRRLILQAYESNATATDSASLVEAQGHKVAIAIGDPRNVKITTPDDLDFARQIFDTLPK